MTNRWVNNIGHALIKSVTLEIGGEVIDTHYADHMSIWNELSGSEPSPYDQIYKYDFSQNFNLEKIENTFDSLLVVINDIEIDLKEEFKIKEFEIFSGT